MRVRFPRFLAMMYLHSGRRGFFLFWSVLTGAAAGGLVLLIRLAARALEGETFRRDGLLFLALPFAGIALSYFIKHFFSRADSSTDMRNLIQSVRKRDPSRIHLGVLPHILASPLCVGLGASAGLTTPCVLTGAAAGSGLGSFLRLPDESRSRMMAWGTAAGIAAIFGTPVSGVLFAAEVFRPKLSSVELVPLLLSAASATVIAQIAPGEHPLLPMTAEPWSASFLPECVILGLLCGAAGAGLVRFNRNANRVLSGVLGTGFRRMLAGGIVVTALTAILPGIAGEGILPLRQIISGEEVSAMQNLVKGAVPAALLLTAGKMAATVLTLGCGGSGGFFAPSLFCGGFLGCALYHAGIMTGFGSGMYRNLLALGMCGFFTAAFRTPLTAIFLALELSGTYVLMIPLLIVAATAYFAAGLLESDSIYAPGSELYGDDSGMKTYLSGLSVRSFMEAPPPLLESKVPFLPSEILRLEKSEWFAVAGRNLRCRGVISRGRIAIAAGEGAKTVLPEDLQDRNPPVCLYPEDSMAAAASAFEMSGRGVVFVLDRRRRPVGLLTARDLESARAGVTITTGPSADENNVPSSPAGKTTGQTTPTRESAEVRKSSDTPTQDT